MQSEEKESEEKKEMREIREIRHVYLGWGPALAAAAIIVAGIALVLRLYNDSVNNNLKGLKSELSGEIATVKSELTIEINEVSKDLEIQAIELRAILQDFRTELEDLRGSIDALQQITEPQAYESLRVGILEDNSPFSEYIEFTDTWQGEDFTIVEALRGVFDLSEEQIEYLPMGDLADMAANPCDYDFSFVDANVWEPPSGYDLRYVPVSDFFPATMTEAWTHAIMVPICKQADTRLYLDLSRAILRVSPK